MKTYLLGVIVAGLLSGSGRAADDVPAVRINATWETLGKVAGRAKGRVLGSLVQNGMTPKQVEDTLGRASTPFPNVGLTGSGIFASWSFYDLGLWVSFRGDETGTLRVDGVNYYTVSVKCERKWGFSSLPTLPRNPSP